MIMIINLVCFLFFWKAFKSSDYRIRKAASFKNYKSMYMVVAKKLLY